MLPCVSGAHSRMCADVRTNMWSITMCPYSVYGVAGEAGFNTLERRWYRPTLEIVGMSGGFTGT